jgi:type I restriction enzyme M protein
VGADSDQTGRLGVHGVAKLILAKLRWDFHELRESDHGIDAIVEITVDGLRTGKLIALQIKSGSSYFAKKSSEGEWILRGAKKRHLAYWLEYQLPVLVVLYDTHAGCGYWVHVNSDTAKFTSKGFRIGIPSAQILDASAKPQIEKIITNRTTIAAEERAELEQMSHQAADQRQLLAQLTTRLNGQITRLDIEFGGHRQVGEVPTRLSADQAQIPSLLDRAQQADGTATHVIAQLGDAQEANTAGRDTPFTPYRAIGPLVEDTGHLRLLSMLWHYYDALRNDGISAIDCVEQISYLLLLKMGHERTASEGFGGQKLAPIGSALQSLLNLDGQDLSEEYARVLRELGQRKDAIGVVFRQAHNRILDPVKLKNLIADLNKERWSDQSMDVKGDAYEELLAKGAEDLISGAGQYFTPRELIAKIVECVQPDSDDIISDPACGTGGFLIEARHYIERHNSSSLTVRQREIHAGNEISGVELAKGPAQLARMNLLLHNISTPGNPSSIEVRDALAKPPRNHPSVVLSNPPWSYRSSSLVVGGDGRGEAGYTRRDFWVTTSSTPLNFIQHIVSMLDVPGRAAIVLPDNVLFAGGAAETIRRRLLSQYDVHTLLRLPTGFFYSGGIKANVLFFDKKSVSPGTAQTSTLWIYDFRTGQRFTQTENRLTRKHLDDFVRCYRPGEGRHRRVETTRFKPFSYDELIARDKANLDISWLDDSSQMATDLSLTVTARAMLEDITGLLAELTTVVETLERANDRPPST